MTKNPYPTPMLSALVFDLDGTLIDSNGLHAEAFVQAFADEGFRIPLDRILPEIGKGADKLIASILGDEAAKKHRDALTDGHEKYVLALIEEQGVEPLPGAEALLKNVRARGLKIAIATASQSKVRDALATAAGLDLEKLADAIVTDDDVDRSKPAPDTVTAAVEKLGLARGVCGFVGDTPYDALSARRAGLAAVAIANPAQPTDDIRRAGMRAIYRDPADLLDHLDAALETLSPGPHRLTDATLDMLMDAALDEARQGAQDGEIPIGAVVARYDGTILARGHNTARATGSLLAHAEMAALRHAASHLSSGTRDTLVVTTMEPCVMCLGAMLQARIDTVVFAHEAPANGGLERLDPIDGADAVWPRSIGGVGREESRALLHRYADAHPEATFVHALLASTPGA